MKFRPDHLQHIAAAKAGFSERTARRIEAHRHLAPQPNAVRTRQVPDPFDGLWDSEIRPLLETHPGLRPVTVLEEMQRRHPDHDWDRLRRSLERRVRAWRAQHGADREVIFRQDHVPGQQALSDFTDMADAGVSIAGQTLNHRLYHFVLGYSAWEHAEPVLGGESFTALAIRYSFCPSSSTSWKHWKLSLRFGATRSCFSPNGDSDTFRSQIGHLDLERRAGHDLFGGENLALDQAPDDVRSDAQFRGGFPHRQPLAILLGGTECVDVVDPPEVTDPLRIPRFSLAGLQTHPVQRRGNVRVVPAPRHASHDRQRVLRGAAPMFTGFGFLDAQL
jgi:hypothetical protein